MGGREAYLLKAVCGGLAGGVEVVVCLLDEDSCLGECEVRWGWGDLKNSYLLE